MEIVSKNKELLKMFLKDGKYNVYFYKRLMETSSFP